MVNGFRNIGKMKPMIIFVNLYNRDVIPVQLLLYPNSNPLILNDFLQIWNQLPAGLNLLYHNFLLLSIELLNYFFSLIVEHLTDINEVFVLSSQFINGKEL